jgi:hypothetical protein
MAKKGKKKNDLTPRARAPKGWHTLFLLTLEATGNVTAACRAADVSRPAAYEQKDNDPVFADQWEHALGSAVDEVEGSLFKMAKENTQAAHIILKAHRHIYREKPPEVNVNNNTLVIEGQDPLELLKSRMADMRERMIEGGVEVIAEVLEPSDVTKVGTK